MEEQKYHKGDKVRVVNIGSPWWESAGDGSKLKVYDKCPEAIGQVGEIEDSKETQGHIKYILKWPEGVKLHVAWWSKDQLEPADTNTPRELQQHYPDYKESNIAKELRKIHDDALTQIMWGKPKQ